VESLGKIYDPDHRYDYVHCYDQHVHLENHFQKNMNVYKPLRHLLCYLVQMALQLKINLEDFWLNFFINLFKKDFPSLDPSFIVDLLFPDFSRLPCPDIPFRIMCTNPLRQYIRQNVGHTANCGLNL